MSGYVIKRDGEVVGYTSDRQLAEYLNGVEIDNDASDPRYHEINEYTTERGDDAE